jgi:hypothetical protein
MGDKLAPPPSRLGRIVIEYLNGSRQERLNPRTQRTTLQSFARAVLQKAKAAGLKIVERRR